MEAAYSSTADALANQRVSCRQVRLEILAQQRCWEVPLAASACEMVHQLQCLFWARRITQLNAQHSVVQSAQA